MRNSTTTPHGGCFQSKDWVRSHHLTHKGREKNGRHFTDDIFKFLIFNENVWISFKCHWRMTRVLSAYHKGVHLTRDLSVQLKWISNGSCNAWPAITETNDDLVYWHMYLSLCRIEFMLWLYRAICDGGFFWKTTTIRYLLMPDGAISSTGVIRTKIIHIFLYSLWWVLF